MSMGYANSGHRAAGAADCALAHAACGGNQLAGHEGVETELGVTTLPEHASSTNDDRARISTGAMEVRSSL